jgi:hypothetical protein
MPKLQLPKFAQKDMTEADLIISHAGAGTVMEGLRLKKRMVVVINTLLMNNHQTELANAMAKRGHLSVVEKPEDLDQMEVWNDFDSFVPIPHRGGDERHFATSIRCPYGCIISRSRKLHDDLKFSFEILKHMRTQTHSLVNITTLFLCQFSEQWQLLVPASWQRYLSFVASFPSSQSLVVQS